MSEATCPLCQLPRLRNANRCVCNYVFEYDAPRAERGRTPSAPSPVMIPILVAIAVAAAVLGVSVARPALRPDGTPWAGFLLVFAGLFAITGSIANWSWFMLAGRARLVTMILTRAGARVFYAALGGFLAGGGLGMGIL